MKRLSLLIICFLVAGCASTSIKRLTAKEFLKEASHVGEMNSFRYACYVGSTPQRAYLETGYPAIMGEGMRVTVYWVPVTELPTNVISQLNAGQSPWTNWMPRVREPALPR